MAIAGPRKTPPGPVSTMDSAGSDQTLPREEALSSGDDVGIIRAKRSHWNRLWRHPFRREIEVPYRVAAAIAVMQMGISDYPVIARAVGLTVEEVERVDTAETSSVRQLALARIPLGESFKLVEPIRCPKCQAEVSLVPCIACCGS